MCLFSKALRPLAGLSVAVAMATPSANASNAPLSCQNIVLPMEDGAQYRGQVKNYEYRFSAVIPGNKIGWGVREPAPFHGFIIFLDGRGQYREGDSCIDLQVGVRVDLPEDDSEKQVGRTIEKSVTIGNKKGLEIVEKYIVGGRPFFASTIRVDRVTGSGGSDYLAVTLITPSDEHAANRKIFNRFLAGIKFW
jgi:hypothetical protein